MEIILVKGPQEDIVILNEMKQTWTELKGKIEKPTVISWFQYPSLSIINTTLAHQIRKGIEELADI